MLMRWRIQRGVAILVVVLVALGLTAAFLQSVIPALVDQFQTNYAARPPARKSSAAARSASPGARSPRWPRRPGRGAHHLFPGLPPPAATRRAAAVPGGRRDRFVRIVGVMVDNGAVICIAVALFATRLWPTTVLVLVFFVVYQQIENYLIAPRIMRGPVQLSAGAVLLAGLIGAAAMGFDRRPDGHSDRRRDQGPAVRAAAGPRHGRTPAPRRPATATRPRFTQRDRGGASMRPGEDASDGTAARRDRGRGSARAPHPQAGRPAALRLVLFRDRRAGGGRRRGQRHHVRRGDRPRGREPPAAACAGCRGQSGGAVRPARLARGHGRPVARPAPVPAARRGGGHRRPGRRHDRGGQRPAHAARRQPALLCDHHGPPGHEPRRGARPLPGGPGRLRHHGRPGRPAVLAERPVGGDRRVRDRAGGSVAHLRAEPADHGARRPRDRPRRQVRRGLRVAAARRPRDRRRAGRRRPAGDRDTAGPPPGTPPGQPLTPLRGHSQGRRRQAGCRRVRPGPAGGRRLLPAVPEGAGARAGVTHRPAVGGPRGRAPGPAVLRGRGRGRAHAAAARRGPGRSRSRRAGLRAPRGDDAGPAESPAAATPSSARSGMRSAGCTPTRSRTGA